MFSADQSALLVSSIYRPERSTLKHCLSEWMALPIERRMRSYLVVDGPREGERHTLSAGRIASLAAELLPQSALMRAA